MESIALVKVLCPRQCKRKASPMGDGSYGRANAHSLGYSRR